MTLYIKLAGGLGNQLFQYALGRRLSLQNGYMVKLDSINGFFNDYFKREFLLNKFGIALSCADNIELQKFDKYLKKNLIGKFNRKLNNKEWGCQVQWGSDLFFPTAAVVLKWVVALSDCLAETNLLGTFDEIEPLLRMARDAVE